MYTSINFPTKKALKEALAAGVQIDVYRPGPFTMTDSFNTPRNGTVYLEGPHYPAAHTWYAQAELRDGLVVKVK